MARAGAALLRAAGRATPPRTAPPSVVIRASSFGFPKFRHYGGIFAGFSRPLVLWCERSDRSGRGVKRNMSSEPDPLDPLLQRWSQARPQMPAPEVLATEVWRRIADAEAAGGEPTLWGRLDAVFSRPSFAAVFIAACTLFGLFLAEVRLSRVQAQRNVQLAQAYIRLIDPLLEQPNPGSPATHNSPAAPANPASP